MSIRHFLSLSDLEPEELSRLISEALAIAKGERYRLRPFEGKIVGIYFRRSSTRTRTAFSAGTLRLGGQIIQYGPNDLQLITGESMRDTGRVLSGFLDILVVRTNDSLDEMKALAEQDKMAVINAMSDNEHPSQAIADLATIHEAMGRLRDVRIMYIGEGNNSAVALALAVAKSPGMHLTLITPEGYGMPAAELETATALARKNKSEIIEHHSLDRLPKRVDVVYTTRWQTMGVPKADPNWQEKFVPYRVTTDLMAAVSKPSGTIFMHDLPAMRGCEVANEVLDGPQSWAFRQSQHKLTSAMSILAWCVSARSTGDGHSAQTRSV